jgi:hypothetical protein
MRCLLIMLFLRASNATTKADCDNIKGYPKPPALKIYHYTDPSVFHKPIHIGNSDSWKFFYERASGFLNSLNQ